MRRGKDRLIAAFDHAAPTGHWWPYAQPDEAQYSFGEDRLRHAICHPDDDWSGCVREQMLQDYSARRSTERARRVDIVTLAQGQQLAAHQPRQICPVDQSDCDQDIDKASPEGGSDDDHEQKVWERVEHVGKAHQVVIDAPAQEAGNPPDGDANRQDDDMGEDANGERHTCAVHQSAEHVTTNVIGTEPVCRAGWGVRLAREQTRRVVRCQHVGQNGDGQQQTDDHQAGDGQPVAEQAAPGVAPQSARRSARHIGWRARDRQPGRGRGDARRGHGSGWLAVRDSWIDKAVQDVDDEVQHGDDERVEQRRAHDE